MIFNVGAGGATDADKIKYGDSNVGATLDELNNSFGTYYDDETETLYIQGGTSNYTYDSATETLYIG